MSSCQYAKHPDEDEEGDGSREGREQQTVRKAMWSSLQSRKETVQRRTEGELAREVGVMLNSVWGILFLPSRLLPGSCHSDLDYYLHLEGS